MSLEPTSEQLAEVGGTIVGLTIAGAQPLSRIARAVWQIVANQVLEAAAETCMRPVPYQRICDCAARILDMKGKP